MNNATKKTKKYRLEGLDGGMVDSPSFGTKRELLKWAIKNRKKFFIDFIHPEAEGARIYIYQTGDWFKDDSIIEPTKDRSSLKITKRSKRQRP